MPSRDIALKRRLSSKKALSLYIRKGGIQMISEYKKQDKLLILKITEEIDHHTSEKIRKRADYEIQIHIPKKVIFDFENVTFMDSSGIGMIIGRYKLVTMFRRNSSIN